MPQQIPNSNKIKGLPEPPTGGFFFCSLTILRRKRIPTVERPHRVPADTPTEPDQVRLFIINAINRLLRLSGINLSSEILPIYT